ncbi:MAG: cytochrome P450 [Acidobacteriota bacterium]
MTSLPPSPPLDFYFAGRSPEEPFDPVDYYRTLWQQAGDLARVPAIDHAPHHIVLAVHPDHVAEVLRSDNDTFRKELARTHGLAPMLGEGSLLCLEGEAWSEERQQQQPAFARPKLEDHIALLRRESEALAQRWEQAAEAGREVDAEDELEVLLVRITSQLFLGLDLDEDRSRALVAAFEAFTEPPPAPMIDPDSLDPELPREQREAAVQKIQDDYRQGLQNKAAEARQLAQRVLREALDANPPGLLGSLLCVESRDDPQRPLDRVVTLLYTGYETCAKALPKTLAHVARDLRLRHALEQEADIPPPPSGPRSAPFSEQLLLETLRLDPPVWTFSRWAQRDTEIGGYEIPEGTLIVLSPFLTHRHPGFWADPESFDPGRFGSEGLGAEDSAKDTAAAVPEQATTHRHAYFPFGGGRHHCLGRALASLEAAEILTALAARLRWSLAPGSSPARHTEGVTLGPGHSIRLRLQRRHPQQESSEG